MLGAMTFLSRFDLPSISAKQTTKVERVQESFLNYGPQSIPGLVLREDDPPHKI